MSKALVLWDEGSEADHEGLADTLLFEFDPLIYCHRSEA